MNDLIYFKISKLLIYVDLTKLSMMNKKTYSSLKYDLSQKRIEMQDYIKKIFPLYIIDMIGRNLFLKIRNLDKIFLMKQYPFCFYHDENSNFNFVQFKIKIEKKYNVSSGEYLIKNEDSHLTISKYKYKDKYICETQNKSVYKYLLDGKRIIDANLQYKLLHFFKNKIISSTDYTSTPVEWKICLVE